MTWLLYVISPRDRKRTHSGSLAVVGSENWARPVCAHMYSDTWLGWARCWCVFVVVPRVPVTTPGGVILCYVTDASRFFGGGSRI